MEICSDIARRLGVEPRPLSIAWDGIIAGLLAGKYDLICGSMAITDKRLQAIDFSDPYYRSGAQLFVAGRLRRSIRRSSCGGKKIGVTLGTTYEEWVRANLPEVEVRTYKGVPEMILEVANGRIDGFVTDRIVGAMAIDEKHAPIQLAGPLLYEERMGIALRQGNPQAEGGHRRPLAAMQEDGDLPTDQPALAEDRRPLAHQRCGYDHARLVDHHPLLPLSAQRAPCSPWRSPSSPCFSVWPSAWLAALCVLCQQSPCCTGRPASTSGSSAPRRCWYSSSSSISACPSSAST